MASAVKDPLVVRPERPEGSDELRFDYDFVLGPVRASATV